MVKNIPVDENVHELLVDKQKELKKKKGVMFTLSELTSKIIELNINKIEEQLFLK